jgi:hypothetical protein
MHRFILCSREKKDHKPMAEESHTHLLTEILINVSIISPLSQVVIQYLYSLPSWIDAFFARGRKDERLWWNRRLTNSDLLFYQLEQKHVCLYLEKYFDRGHMAQTWLRVPFVLKYFILDEKNEKYFTESPQVLVAKKLILKVCPHKITLYFQHSYDHPTFDRDSDIIARDCNRKKVSMKNDSSNLALEGIFRYKETCSSLVVSLNWFM